MSQKTRQLVESFRRIVQPDGGDLEFLGVEGATLRVRYTPGHNEECETCVILPEDLRELIRESVTRQDPSITDVELITVGESGSPLPEGQG